MAMLTLSNPRLGRLGSEGWTARSKGKVFLFSLRWTHTNLMQSLCSNCGLRYERDKRLPPWAKHIHIQDIPLSGR